MKPRYIHWMLVSTAGLIAFLSSGCYTQFGSTKDEGVVRYEDQQDEYAYDDSVATTEDYDNARDRFYEDNYYPGYGFGMGFYDPWSWNYRSGYGYGYGYYGYDPYYGWCGTSYPYYSAWWSRPVFGYRSSLYYGPVHRGGSGYMTKAGSGYGSSRAFGSTRSSGGVRGATVYTPGGTRSGSLGTAPSAGTYQTKPRSSGSAATKGAVRSTRVTSPRGSHESTRTDTPRSYPRPSSGGRESGRDVRSSSPPPSSSGNSGGSSGGHDGGRGERSGGASSSAPSSPPPSSGGGAPTNTGDRGGNRR